MTIDGDKQRKKKRKSTDEKVKFTKMEIDEEEPVDNPVPKEAEADKPASKRAKLGNEISLLDRLHGSDPISTLRDLDQIMQSDLVNEEDTISKFLEQGGSARDLLALLDKELKVKTSDVVVIFGAMESLLHNLAKRVAALDQQSGEETETFQKKLQQLALDITRSILEDHIRYIVLLLSPSNTAYQVRTGLGLLTSMVACGPLIAKEVLLKLDFSHPSFESLTNRQNSSEIREGYIRFFLSFLLHSDSASLMRIYMDKCKVNLAAIFPRIGLDTVHLIQFILITLREKFIANLNVSKTDKMKLFSVANLKPILQLSTKWKPPGLKPDQQESDDDKAEIEAHVSQVKESSRDFLVALFTSHKLGIVFYDPTAGTSGQNQNHLLQNFLRTTENSWESEHLSEIVVKSLSANPDQLKPFLQKVLQPLWTPRATQTWQQVSKLVVSLFEAIDLQPLMTEANKRPNFSKLSASIVKNIFCYDNLFRELIGPAIECSESHSIREQGIRILSMILGKIDEIYGLKIFETNRDSLRSVLSALSGRMPTLKSVVAFWQLEVEKLKAQDKVEKKSFETLLCAAKVLHFYKKNFPRFFSDINVQDFLSETQPLFARMNLEGLREDADSIQLFLLKIMSSGSVDKGINFSSQLEYVRMLVNIGSDSSNVKNSLVAVQTLESVFQFDPLFSDLLRVWLHSMPLENSIREEMCSIISTLLTQRETIQDQLGTVATQYPTLIIDSALLSLVRSKVLKKKFGDYFNACLRGMIFLQEDPSSFCRFLSKEENLVEYRNIENVVKSATFVSQNYTEFFQIVSAMQILTEIKIKKSATEKLTEFLGNNFHRADISTKILSQKSVKSKFDPLQENLEFTKMIFELLVFNREEKLAKEYSELFVETLTRCFIKNQVKKGADLAAVDRAFEILRLSSAQVELLLITFLENIEPKTFRFLNGIIFCSILSSLIEIHSSNFMDVLFRPQSRTFVSLAVEFVLQVEQPSKTHSRLLQSVNENFEMDSEFWGSFSPESIKLGCESKLRESGRFLELLVRNSNEKRAASFRQMARKDIDLIKENFTKYLPSVAASLSKKFSTSIKSKTAESLCKNFIGEILIQKPDEISPQMAAFVVEVSENYKIPVDLSDFFPMTGKSPYQLRIIFELAKKNSDKYSIIVEHILSNILEIFPSNLKDLSKNLENENLKSLIDAFCDLSCDCITALEDDNLNLLKEKIGKKENDLWQTFVRACLKHGLKLKLHQVVQLLSKFCRSIYDSANSVEIGQIYDMVCGHSSFVDTLLSASRKELDVKLKESVLELVLTLIKCKGSIIGSAQLPLFLGAYRASLSKPDRILLRIIYHHDFNFEDGVPLQAFKPLLWGDAAVAKYSHRSTNTSARPNRLLPHLSKIPKSSEVLGLIDVQKMVDTSIAFPLSLGMDFNNLDKEDEFVENSNLYDPRFFLHLFAQICSSENYVDRHLKLIESGVLGLALASLSSRDEMIRAAGATLVSRVYMQLESARKSLSAEKQVWLHLINVVRNGIANSGKRQRSNDDAEDGEDYHDDDENHRGVIRIPGILSAFLVRTCMILNNPLDPMYKAISSFLLAKPMLVVYGIPEFLRLFHSKDPLQHDTEREWIVSVLRDGIRDDLSYSLMQQSFVFKMLQGFHDSSMVSLVGLERAEESGSLEEDSPTKSLILQVIRRSVELPKAAFDLVRNRGLLVWVLSQLGFNDKLNPAVLDIVVQSWRSVSRHCTPQSGHRLPPSLLIQFLQTANRLLHQLPSMERHYQLEGVKGLLQVFCDVVAMLKNQEDTRAMLPSGLAKNVQEMMRETLKSISWYSKDASKQCKPVYVTFQTLVSLSTAST